MFAVAKRFVSSQAVSKGERVLIDKLVKRFAPTRIVVKDISGGCGSMFAVDVASKVFEGVGVVGQHRMVNECLKDEIVGMHGIQIKTAVQ